MSLPTTYTELKATLLEMVDNSEANIDTARAIALAEKRFNRILNMPEMEATTTLSTTATTALPTDLWEIRSLHLETDPRALLEPVSIAVLRGRYNAQSTGQPQVYAVVGQNIIFGPAPDSTYSATLVYKQSITALSDSNATNFLLSKYTDLYIYGALMWGEMTVWNDARAILMKARWDEIMDEVRLAGIRYKAAGAPRRIRSPVRGAC